jgi:hypothetical protein
MPANTLKMVFSATYLYQLYSFSQIGKKQLYKLILIYEYIG